MIRIRNRYMSGYVPEDTWERIQKHQASMEMPSVIQFDLQIAEDEREPLRCLAITAIDPISKLPAVDYHPWIEMPPKLSKEVIEELSPGVRELVVWLNNQGFDTTDSGDGSNFAAGMECACPVPMVSIKVTPNSLVIEADRLAKLLEERGLKFTSPATAEEAETAASLEATYFPTTGIAMLVLVNVLSKDVGL